MADARQISRQEQVLAEAQKRLERIEKMREQMVAQIEKEMAHLEKLREEHEKFMQSSETTPALGASAPESFQSQFDKFNQTKSNERLSGMGNEGIGNAILSHLQTLAEKGSDTADISVTDKIPTEKPDEPYYRHSDRAHHWTSLIEDPGKPIYVSGRYVSSEHGNHMITTKQEYEYELSTRALPMSVGDIIRVPVHPTGHGDGKAFSTGHLQYMVTDIYDTPRFHSYHDRIDG